MNGHERRRQSGGLIPSDLLVQFEVCRKVASHAVGIFVHQGKNPNKAGEHEKRNEDYQVHGRSFREVYLPKRCETGHRYI